MLPRGGGPGGGGPGPSPGGGSGGGGGGGGSVLPIARAAAPGSSNGRPDEGSREGGRGKATPPGRAEQGGTWRPPADRNVGRGPPRPGQSPPEAPPSATRGASPPESAQRQQPSVLEAAHWYDAVATEHNLGVLSAPQLAALQTSHLRILQQLQRASTTRLRELKLAARRPKSGGMGGGAED